MTTPLYAAFLFQFNVTFIMKASTFLIAALCVVGLFTACEQETQPALITEEVFYGNWSFTHVVFKKDLSRQEEDHTHVYRNDSLSFHANDSLRWVQIQNGESIEKIGNWRLLRKSESSRGGFQAAQVVEGVLTNQETLEEERVFWDNISVKGEILRYQIQEQNGTFEFTLLRN